ncbi:MAG TPA: SdpI family protein [Telluria sp.]|nr:SdpI family protein [Telluria sp.]
MKTRYLTLCGLLLLATLAVTLAMYTQLPAQIPTHWNGRGQIDHYGPRSFIFVHTGFMVGFMLLWTVLPWLSPKRYTLALFQSTYWHILLIMVGMLAYIQCMLVWGAYSQSMDMNRAMLGGVGVFVALIGNVLGKVKRNFWIGIRTPWTLADERVWYATHRLGAKTMVAGALLCTACALAGLPAKLCVALLVAGAVVPALYSLVYAKRLERSADLEN